MKNRLSYIDLAKAIAIWLVVWGHALSCLADENTMKGGSFEWIGNWIYSFHMPLFMILSGFFASSALQRPIYVMAWSKFRQLIWPCITFGCILAVFYRYWNMNIDALQHGVLFMGLVYDYWFLHCLFANFLIAWVVYRFPRRLQLVVFAVLFSAICFMFSKGHNLWNMSTMMIPFFVGIESKPFLSKLEQYKILIFVACAILFLLMFPLYDSYFNGSTYFFMPFTFIHLCEWLYREVIGIVGSVEVIAFCIIVVGRFKNYRIIEQILKIGGYATSVCNTGRFA